MNGALSNESLDALVDHAAPAARAGVARRVAQAFARRDLGAAERTFAIDAFRLLVRDDDPAVRAALAEGLRDNPLVPHDVVRSLAADVADVAAPILEHSIVLADEDLVEIVRGGNQAHRLAIARRPSVSRLLAHALIELGNEAVALTLLGNPGADVGEDSYGRLLAAFPEGSPVVEGVADHHFASVIRSAAERGMPPALAERLVHRVAERLGSEVAAQAHLSASGDALIARARERATLALVGETADEARLADLVRHLIAVRRLSASLVVRAMASGRFDFATAALAQVSGFEAAHVQSVIRRRQQAGFKVIARAARLPEAAAAALLLCLKSAKAAAYQGGSEGLKAFQDRLLALAGDATGSIEAAIDRLASDRAPLAPGANG
jgi:uncharacterized protein (DUF2336 family)